jgi:hypothetical protein
MGGALDQVEHPKVATLGFPAGAPVAQAGHMTVARRMFRPRRDPEGASCATRIRSP